MKPRFDRAKMAMAAVSAILLASTGTAKAGDPGSCAAYAAVAVQQQQRNTANGCGFGGPRWNPDYGAHFAWCLIASTSQAKNEQNKRESLLNQCANPAPVAKKFNKPKIGGLRLDWCRVWAGQCGKPAAKEYCNTKGYSNTTGWQKDSNIGSWTKTRVISSGQVCAQPGCDGFKWIKCSG